jgi:glycosyltransferase involved in cell wall biosynthesis
MRIMTGLRVLYPQRVLDRHVGGNTTYTRRLRQGLIENGIEPGLIPRGSNPITTIFRESAIARRVGRPGTVLHYTSDTGPVLRAKVPAVVTVHGIASRWVSDVRTPAQEAIWRFRVRRAISAVEKVITVSESSADDLHAELAVDRDRLAVIPHGIDVERFAAHCTLDVGAGRRLPAEYVLYVGNVEPRKNLVALIEAMQQEPLRQLGLQLIIAGRRAWSSGPTMAAIREHPNVLYLDFVDDDTRNALMQNCRLFVFPSLYEGFGFPVLEALAAGAPVAATRRGALRDVAGPAWELPDTDAEGLSESIARALADTGWQARCRAEGPRWAARFSWQSSIERHIQLYRELSAR